MLYATLAIFIIVLFVLVTMRKTSYSLAFTVIFSAMVLMMCSNIFCYVNFANYKMVFDFEIWLFEYISKLKVSYYEIKNLAIISMTVFFIGLNMIGIMDSLKQYSASRNFVQIGVSAMFIFLFAFLNSNQFCELLFLWQHSGKHHLALLSEMAGYVIRIYDMFIIIVFYAFSLKNIVDKYISSQLFLYKKQFIIILICLVIIGIVAFGAVFTMPVFHVFNSLHIYGFDSVSLSNSSVFDIYFSFGYVILLVACCVVLVKYRVLDIYVFFKRKSINEANVAMHDLRHVFHTLKNYALIIVALQKKSMKEINSGKGTESLEKIRTTALDLISQCGAFLDIYTGFDFHMDKINIVECINAAVNRQEYGDVRVSVSVETDNLYIYANKNIITEMCANIIQNSLDALNTKGADGGNIIIRVISERDVVCISFYDDGCGLSHKQMKKIFKPFVSSKRNFEHWGLGLSYVLNAVNLHSGFIDIKSKENRFTEIQIAFNHVS